MKMKKDSPKKRSMKAAVWISLLLLIAVQMLAFVLVLFLSEALDDGGVANAVTERFLWIFTAIIAVPLVIGVLFARLALSVIITPMETIMNDVRNVDPEKVLTFTQTNVAEYDILTGLLTKTSDEMRLAAMRTSSIIGLMGISIGCFEIDRDKGRVFVSESLFGMLSIPRAPEDGMFVPLETWEKLIAELPPADETENHPEGEAVYPITRDGAMCWLRLRTTCAEGRELGVFEDITGEMQSKLHLERQRQLDPMTGLYNRAAFQKKADEMMKAAPEKTGLMVYCDLDNLKFYNDTFGHEVGDAYICKMAESIGMFAEVGGIAARFSGDEMAVYIHGYGSKAQLYEMFQNIYTKIGRIQFVTPDDAGHKIRMSAGLAFYPEHGRNSDRLIRCADFAMYEIKHTIKGSVKEFDEISYNEKSFVFLKKHILDRFIEGNLVKYAFQPIVDVRTGRIHAFEALMRPQMDDMRSPMQVLQLARSQSKLYQIERMTVNNVLEILEERSEAFGDRKVFVNTIPNQVLMGRDLTDFTTRYVSLFPRVVFELTEDEHTDAEFLEAKQTMMRGYGAKVAIDDFGAGYSNDLSLLVSTPDYLKIDMSIVRDIDTDPDRQHLLTNILTFAKGKDILVIAEGCETFDEVNKLCELGVDYLQGYYIAKPNFELVEIPEGVGEQLRKLYEEYHGTAMNNEQITMNNSNGQ